MTTILPGMFQLLLLRLLVLVEFSLVYKFAGPSWEGICFSGNTLFSVIIEGLDEYVETANIHKKIRFVLVLGMFLQSVVLVQSWAVGHRFERLLLSSLFMLGQKCSTYVLKYPHLVSPYFNTDRYFQFYMIGYVIAACVLLLLSLRA